MGLRKLTSKERKAMYQTAVVMLARGEHSDDVRAELDRYLRSRDWPPLAASTRAREVCELAARTEPGPTTPMGEPHGNEGRER